MSVVMRIAREEWRSMARDRVAVFGLLLLTVLTLVAAITAFEHRRAASGERARYQAQVNQAFEAQPDRHPHRVVHSGHFLFRPLNALAAFDPGIDAYTGHTVFLEGHRQNGASFGDVRQSSLLLRFGQLTPAFVLQVLAPLLLIFVGHAVIARERESGTLRVLLAQGVGSRDIVWGKFTALAGFAALALLPALLALAWLGASGRAAWPPIALLALGYAAWLLSWSVGVVLVSSSFAHGRDALLTLLAVWTVMVILLPRTVPDVANTVLALPTKLESDIAVEREYRALGDAHNPDDPYFAAFRDKVLKQYGVSRVEDLPVNFKGLVGMEGERASSELFNRYAAAGFARQQAQNRLVDDLGWLSPTLALRRLSMTASGTDLESFRGFLDQAEQYRYALIQGLNKLEADKISYADDKNPDKENRVSRANWMAFPTFDYHAAPVAEIVRRAAPAAAVLLFWLLLLGAMLLLTPQRLGRAVR